MRRAPTNARKVLTLPTGTRLDRAAVILGAIKTDCATTNEERRHTLVTLADGSIAVYRHYTEQS